MRGHPGSSYMMRFLRLIVILSLSLATLLIEATRPLYAGEPQSCAEYRQILAQDERIGPICALPILTALVGMDPLAFARENTLYARSEGALVCPTHDPLLVYKQIYQDAVARAKYLDSTNSSQCKKLSPDTEAIV